ncbi:MAG: GNAT family N-acetyltransferase, partial [Myxococcota bacterium]
LCAVAEHEGRLVGTVALALRTVRQGGRTIWMAYPMDARVDPAYQHKGVFKAVWGYLRQALGDLPIDAMMGFILHGNRRAVGAARQMFPGVTVREAADFHLVHFSMYWPYREPKGLEVGPATDDDRDAVVDLLEVTYRNHSFVPVMNRVWLDRQLERSTGYSMSNIHVVREGEGIVALLGLWDQSAIRRLIVLRNPLTVRLGIAAAHLLHLFIPSPPPPRIDEPLQALYIKHVACLPGYEEPLRGMMRIVLNRVRRQKKYALVWGAFYHNDPYLKFWKDFATTESLSRMYYVPGNTDWDVPPEPLCATPAYADFSMV